MKNAVRGRHCYAAYILQHTQNKKPSSVRHVQCECTLPCFHDMSDLIKNKCDCKQAEL